MDVCNCDAFKGLFMFQTVYTISSMRYTFEKKLAPFTFYHASICIKCSVSVCFAMLPTVYKIHEVCFTLYPCL
jgi:hypothetical protein